MYTNNTNPFDQEFSDDPIDPKCEQVRLQEIEPSLSRFSTRLLSYNQFSSKENYHHTVIALSNYHGHRWQKYICMSFIYCIHSLSLYPFKYISICIYNIKSYTTTGVDAKKRIINYCACFRNTNQSPNKAIVLFLKTYLRLQLFSFES